MLKPESPDDIGITVNSVENNEQRRSPAANFFVSFWTRVKFLFTTALAEVCDCSVASKHHLSHADSFSIKGDEDCIEEETLCNSNKPPLNAAPTEQEPAKIALLHDFTDETIGDPQVEAKEVPDNPPKVAVMTLLQESSHNINKSYESLCSSDSINEEHLEPIDLRDEVQFSTAITFAHPTMMASVEPELYHSKLLQVAEKTQLFEVPLTTEEEEIHMTNDFPAESVCSSSEISTDIECFQPLTTLGRLQTKLMNGDITNEKYQELASSVITSTLPRNLSDSDETRKTRGANQLYAWQIPPPLPKLHSAEQLVDIEVPEAPVMIEECNPSAFVESLISTAVEKITREYQNNGDPDQMSQLVDHVDGSKAKTPDPLLLETPKPSDISYDGIQCASLDRMRSPAVSAGTEGVRSKRSSSLKSERSPDDTPCRKIVRFADSLGLDLVSVRQVKDADNPPNIPASATLDLNLDTEKTFSTLGAKQYQICFPQPGASASFMHRVLDSFVCLENARIDSSRGLLTGTIRVKSVGFEKKVAVRITYNNWSTFFEIPAAYVQDSYDGSTDRFSFCAVFPNTMVANDRAQFAIRYETHEGVTYWDNNHGENYVITCYAKATDMAGDGSWIHYL